MAEWVSAVLFASAHSIYELTSLAACLFVLLMLFACLMPYAARGATRWVCFDKISCQHTQEAMSQSMLQQRDPQRNCLEVAMRTILYSIILFSSYSFWLSFVSK